MTIPRTRSLLIAGVVTGATTLAGAGLAGATGDDPTDAAPVEIVEITNSDDATEDGNIVSATAQDAEGGPEQGAAVSTAAQQQGADGAADAAGADAAASGEPTTKDADGTQGPDTDNHGAVVSATAQDNDGEGDHGDEVSAVARDNHGAERSAQARQDRTGGPQAEEDTGDDDLDD